MSTLKFSEVWGQWKTPISPPPQDGKLVRGTPGVIPWENPLLKVSRELSGLITSGLAAAVPTEDWTTWGVNPLADQIYPTWVDVVG